MTCNEFLSLLPLYPDAMPGDNTLAAFRAHAAECPDCENRLKQQETMLRSLQELDSDLVVPDAFSEGWRARVRDEAAVKPSTAGRFTRWIAAAAAIVTVIGGTALMRGGHLFPYPSPDPQALYAPLPPAAPEPSAMMYMGETEGGAADAAQSTPMLRGGMNVGAMDAGRPKETTAVEQSGIALQPIILRSASVHLESEQYDQDLAAVEALLSEAGGWTEYRSVSGEPLATNPEAGRYAYLTVRVPADTLDSFVKALGGIGTLTGSDMTSEDISENYYDTKGRLAMYEAQRDRLTELMAQAQSVSDIIEIESRLSEVQYTIESLVGRLNNWNSRAQSAIVSVSVTEVAPEGKYARASFGGRIHQAFTQSLHAARAFFADMLVFLVMIAPYVLALCIAALAVYLAVSFRKSRQRRKQP